MVVRDLYFLATGENHGETGSIGIYHTAVLVSPRRHADGLG